MQVSFPACRRPIAAICAGPVGTGHAITRGARSQINTPDCAEAMGIVKQFSIFETRRFRVLAGIGAQIANKGIVTAIRFIELPAFIYIWGPEKYGRWLAIISVVQLVTMSDFGFGASAASRISFHHSRGDSRNIGIFVGTALGVTQIFTLILVFALLLIARLDRAITEWPALILTLISITLSLQGRTLSSTISAVGFFAVASGIESCYLVLNLLLPLLFSWLGWGFTGAAGGLAIAATFYVAAQSICYRKCVWKKGMQIKFERATFYELFWPSIALLGYSVALWLQLQGVLLFVISAFGPTAGVAFTAMRTLARLPLIVSNVVLHPLLPELAMAIGKNDGSFVFLFQRLLKLLSGGLLSAGLGVGVFSSFVLNMWLGGKVQFDYFIFYPLLAGACIESLRAAFGYALMARLAHTTQALACVFGYTLSILLLYTLRGPGFDLHATVMMCSIVEIPLLAYSVLLFKQTRF